MIKYLFVILTLFLSSYIVLAGSAHNHEEVSIQIAQDSNKGIIDINIPAVLVIGFEHSPRNPRETKKAEDAILELNNRLSKWFLFSPLSECQLLNPKTEWKRENTEHSEIRAQVSFECKKSLVGQNLKIHLRNSYPNIKSIKIEALIETLQKSWILNKKQDLIEFK